MVGQGSLMGSRVFIPSCFFACFHPLGVRVMYFISVIRETDMMSNSDESRLAVLAMCDIRSLLPRAFSFNKIDDTGAENALSRCLLFQVG